MPKTSKLSPHDQSVQMAVGDLDHKKLQIESLVSDVGMIDLVNQLLYLSHLRVQCAKDGAAIDPAMMGSEIELYTLLTLHDIGLLTDEEFASALIVAHRYPMHDVGERLKELREITSERLQLLKSHWEERRREMANWKTQWVPRNVGKKPEENEVYVPPVSLDAE